MSEKIVQTAGRDQLGSFAPMFAHLNDDVLFGEVWNEVHHYGRITDGFRHNRFFTDISSAECQSTWCDQRGDRCGDNPCDHVYGMAQGMGSIPSGKRSLERIKQSETGE